MFVLGCALRWLISVLVFGFALGILKSVSKRNEKGAPNFGNCFGARFGNQFKQFLGWLLALYGSRP